MSIVYTKGPWRWEFNQKSKNLHLVGGRPMFDLTVIDFVRWGTHSAVPRARDLGERGMNVMHRLCDRPDWVRPFPGRGHHASWCQAVTHPDMVLVETAPLMLEALMRLEARGHLNSRRCADADTNADLAFARQALNAFKLGCMPEEVK